MINLESVLTRCDISIREAIKVLDQKKISNENQLGYQLEVAITPPDDENKAKFTDQLSLNIKNDEELSIRCNGYYTKRTR